MYGVGTGCTGCDGLDDRVTRGRRTYRRACRRLTRFASLALVVIMTMTVGLTSAGARSREPSLAPGALLVSTARGFAPNATVTERLVGSAASAARVTSVPADAHGEVKVRCRVPRTAGKYRLLLVGRVAATPAPTGSGGTGSGDRQAVVVQVPLLVRLEFRVVGSRDGGGAGVAGTTVARHPGTGSLPAATGGDLLTPVRFGLLALLLGVTLLVAGRVRRGRGCGENR